MRRPSIDVRRSLAVIGVATSAVLLCFAAPAAATPPSPPTITTDFNFDTIGVQGTDDAIFVISNPTPTQLTGVDFSDSLPAGIVVAAPQAITSDCGGSIVATPGSADISLAAATLAGSAQCTIFVTVQASTPGLKSNTTGPVSSAQTGAGQGSNTVTIEVIPPPILAAQFGAAAVALGAATTLTFTVSNPASDASFVNVDVPETLPPGLAVADPTVVTGSCLDDGAALMAAPGGNSIELAGMNLPDAAHGANSCSFSVDIVGTSPGVKNIRTGAPVATFDDGSGAFFATTGPGASTSLTVVAPPKLSAEFRPAAVGPGSATSLTFTLGNPNRDAALSGVAFADALPAGLALPNPIGLTGSCPGATVSAVPGQSSIAVSGVSLAAMATCEVSVDVATSREALEKNLTGPPGSVEGGAGTAAASTLFVGVPPSVSAAFVPAAVFPGGLATLELRIRNPNALVALSAINLAVRLPSGVSLGPAPAPTSTCPGGMTAASDTIMMSGASLPPGASCTISILTRAVGSPGIRHLLTDRVAATETGEDDGAAATASLDVLEPPRKPPENQFSVTELRPGRHGIVRISVHVPGPGVIEVRETIPEAAGHLWARVRLAKAGGARLTIKPGHALARVLRRRRRPARALLEITFTPVGGIARTRRYSAVRLVWRR